MLRSISGGLLGDGQLLVLTLVGLLAVPLTFRLARRRSRAGDTDLRATRVRAALDVAVIVAVVAILVVTVMPQDLGRLRPVRGTSLVPLRSISQMATTSVDATVAVRNIAGNLLLFAPLGFILALRARGVRSFHAASIGALALSVTVEVTQALVPLGRSVDVDDVILNVLGSSLGAGLAVLLRRCTRRHRAQPKRPC